MCGRGVGSASDSTSSPREAAADSRSDDFKIVQIGAFWACGHHPIGGCFAGVDSGYCLKGRGRVAPRMPGWWPTFRPELVHLDRAFACREATEGVKGRYAGSQAFTFDVASHF